MSKVRKGSYAMYEHWYVHSRGLILVLIVHTDPFLALRAVLFAISLLYHRNGFYLENISNNSPNSASKIEILLKKRMYSQRKQILKEGKNLLPKGVAPIFEAIRSFRAAPKVKK